MKKILASTILSLSVLASGALPAHAGWAAGVASYNQGDFATALRQFREDDSANSHFYLSVMYQKGEGIVQNKHAAMELLRTAAEEGLDVAQADLGLAYLDGMGVPADEEEGLKWLKKAADQGLAEARSALTLLSGS